MQPCSGRNTLLSYLTRRLRASVPPPWTINYRNPLPPAPGARIWFLTKCLLRDYVGFDMSSDTEVLMLLKDFLTIPPMISHAIDVYLFICSLHPLWVKTRSRVCVPSLISALSSLCLSLFCSSTETPGFVSLHKKPQSYPPTTRAEKGITSVYLHTFMLKKQEEETQTEDKKHLRGCGIRKNKLSLED